jgi:hypothetical protein
MGGMIGSQIKVLNQTDQINEMNQTNQKLFSPLSHFSHAVDEPDIQI